MQSPINDHSFGNLFCSHISFGLVLFYVFWPILFSVLWLYFSSNKICFLYFSYVCFCYYFFKKNNKCLKKRFLLDFHVVFFFSFGDISVSIIPTILLYNMYWRHINDAVESIFSYAFVGHKYNFYRSLAVTWIVCVGWMKRKNILNYFSM